MMPFRFIRELLTDLNNKFSTIFLFSFSGIINSSLGLLLGPFIIKNVGIANFGYLAIANTVYAFFLAFIDFGITSHLINKRNLAPSEYHREISNAFLLKGLLFGLIVVLYFTYYLFYPHPEVSKKLLGILLITGAVSVLHLEWFFLAKQKFITLVKSRLFYGLTYLLCILFWYQFLESVYWIPVWVVAAHCVSIGSLLVADNSFLKVFDWHSLGIGKIRGIFLSLAPMAGVSFITPFFAASGILLMERSGANGEMIGLYSIPHRITIGWLALAAPSVFYFLPKWTPDQKLMLPYIFKVCFLISLAVYLASLCLLVFYLYFSNLGFENYSLLWGVLSVLWISIFHSFMRVKYVSAYVGTERYGGYFLSHLMAALPVIWLLIMIPRGPNVYLVALAACIPDVLITWYMVWDHHSRTPKRQLAGNF